MRRRSSVSPLPQRQLTAEDLIVSVTSGSWYLRHTLYTTFQILNKLWEQAYERVQS